MAQIRRAKVGPLPEGVEVVRLAPTPVLSEPFSDIVNKLLPAALARSHAVENAEVTHGKGRWTVIVPNLIWVDPESEEGIDLDRFDAVAKELRLGRALYPRELFTVWGFLQRWPRIRWKLVQKGWPTNPSPELQTRDKGEFFGLASARTRFTESGPQVLALYDRTAAGKRPNPLGNMHSGRRLHGFTWCAYAVAITHPNLRP